MKTSLLAVFIAVAAATNLTAARVNLLSPDKAATFAIGWLDDKYLFWDAKKGILCACLRFSNRPVSESRVQETFVFTFPDVKRDDKTGAFYAKSQDGQRVVIAERSKGFLGPAIVPTPGTFIFVINDHGTVNLLLKSVTGVTTDSAFTKHWIERDDAATLQNLVRDLTRSN